MMSYPSFIGSPHGTSLKKYVVKGFSAKDSGKLDNINSRDSSHSSAFTAATAKRDFPDDEKMLAIYNSDWGGFGLDPELWDDEHAPVVKILNLNDIELDHFESSGILSDRLVGVCSSFLTTSPENGHLVLSKCTLRRMKLVDISVLEHHRYLQYLDLSHNLISDLSPLGGIPYLMYLNASHNALKYLLDFHPPFYLTYVNLSYNKLSKIDDLSGFWSLVRLDLSHNSIERITGLQNLKYLLYLNISYNIIECVENLDDLNIQELNMEFNCIKKFKSSGPAFGINMLPNLRTLNLSQNRISTLRSFEGTYGLKIIDLSHNRIDDLFEVSHLKSLVYQLDLRGNSCTTWPNYRAVVLNSMPSIKFLDGAEVSVSEKVSASTLFAPSVELLAARSIAKLTLLEQLNSKNIGAHLTPYDETNLPLVILSGPEAGKKLDVALQVVSRAGSKVKYCRRHTTRDGPESPDDEREFIFLEREEFNETARRGEFLAVQELLGNSYGFHIDEIVGMHREGKIGITQMDLHGSLQMYNRYHNVKIVLLTTKDPEIHRRRIAEKFEVFTWIKNSMENLFTFKEGYRKSAAVVESQREQSKFIEKLLNEMIDKLEIPVKITFDPSKAPAMKITGEIETENCCRRGIKMRTQWELEEKRHIKFEDDERDPSLRAQSMVEKYGTKLSSLKVILDEKSNIIIDDEEAKRKRRKMKTLFKHNLMDLDDIVSLRSETLEVLTLSSDDSSSTLFQELQEDPEFHKYAFIERVLKTRELYVDYHRNNPGFYSLVLLTDDLRETVDSLLTYLREIYLNQGDRKPFSYSEIDFIQKNVIPGKIVEIVKELREDISTTKSQKKNLFQFPKSPCDFSKNPLKNLEMKGKRTLEKVSITFE